MRSGISSAFSTEENMLPGVRAAAETDGAIVPENARRQKYTMKSRVGSC